MPLGTAGKIRFEQNTAGWRARCSFRDYDGITRPVERAGATKGAAERALKEAIRDRGNYNRDADLNPDTRFSVVIEAWWQTFATQEGSLGSKNNYRQQVDNHVLPSLGNLRCRELTVGMAERFLRRLEEKNGKSITKTVRTALSNICGFAARMDAMERNPVRDTSPIKFKRKDPKGLDVAGLRQLRAFATYHDRAVRRDVPWVIDFLAATGKRVGECLAVTEEDIDLEEGSVAVRATVVRLPGVGLTIKREPKSEAGFRTLKLPAWIMPQLTERVTDAAHSSARVITLDDHTELVLPKKVSTAGRRKGDPPDWLQKLLNNGQERTESIALLFPSSLGTLRDPSNVAHDIKDVFAFAGLPGDTSHLVRKSVATQMDDAGIPVRKIADQLGHSRTSMTQDAYLDRNRRSTVGASVLQSLDFGDA
ncbi:tyrosine-type recombinase/integrase [Actinoplanes sp. LDG1-06]|uniref:Tyrosine-type recombinase/integrase n=1 Tax=Paractinoplanes ovalisporus TaxID=2810368 RepID=A0ABS2ASX9_9ACTN|nr:tyrosine-type recombinase/integrase [Actinoplanes ovalisporus]MBM2622931.1 tyrosine-type recombinase/integrase [Actinoplanes ovalisporus]